MDSMTKGQALYAATAASLGIDPDKHGSQAEILACCDDIIGQPALSKFRTGAKDPTDQTVRDFEERFRFRLLAPSTAWGFVSVGGEE